MGRRFVFICLSGVVIVGEGFYVSGFFVRLFFRVGFGFFEGLC